LWFNGGRRGVLHQRRGSHGSSGVAAAQAGRRPDSAWLLSPRRTKVCGAQWSGREGVALGRWAGVVN
jgi:hypothetical protein